MPARSLLQRRDAPPVAMLGVGNLMLGVGAVVLFNSTKMLLVGTMRVLMHEGCCSMMMHRGEGNYAIILWSLNLNYLCNC